MTEAEVVEAIRDAVVRAVSPQRIVLFGSRASGRAGQHSDYDLLIVVDTDRPSWEVQVEARLAAAHVRVPMDLIVLTPEELERELSWPHGVVAHAVKTGRVIHEAA